jgi:hypothetical protein
MPAVMIVETVTKCYEETSTVGDCDCSSSANHPTGVCLSGSWFKAAPGCCGQPGQENECSPHETL